MSPKIIKPILGENIAQSRLKPKIAKKKCKILHKILHSGERTTLFMGIRLCSLPCVMDGIQEVINR